MKNIFSHDSQLVSVLSFIADLFILNVIYLACCLPIFTIGAAQAGLHTAVRILIDPNDDRSVIKAFFRGFRNGFGRITVAWVIWFVVELILAYTLFITYTLKDADIFVHWAVPLVMLCLTLCYQTMLPLFHSRFDCTLVQLLYNCVLMFVWHPLATVVSGVLICAPLIMFLMLPNLFIEVTPLFLTVYYSFACMIIAALTQKSFNALIDEFNKPDEEDTPEVKEEVTVTE